MEKHLAYIGDNLDKLASLEMRGQRPDQGLIGSLYLRARQKLGQPLSMLAAARLAEQVGAGDRVILNTGAGRAPVLPKGETDGPLGAAAIARMLRYGLKALPVVLCEAEFVEAIAAICVACGLSVRAYDEAAETPFGCVVQAFPSDDTAEQVAQDIMHRMQPKAVIAVEKLGPNALGVVHDSAGRRIEAGRARAETLFALAGASGVLTIGIGDNGNEIGFGLIEEAVRELKEFGDVCQCPCQGGVASAVPADVVIVSGTSNWGGYAVEAALAALLGVPEFIHDEQSEKRMLEEYVRLGGVDASTGTPTPTVDGTPARVQVELLDLMRHVVASGLRPGRVKNF